MDATDLKLFSSTNVAAIIYDESTKAVQTLSKGQLDMNDDRNKTLILFAQINGIEDDEDNTAVQDMYLDKYSEEYD